MSINLIQFTKVNCNPRQIIIWLVFLGCLIVQSTSANAQAVLYDRVQVTSREYKLKAECDFFGCDSQAKVSDSLFLPLGYRFVGPQTDYESVFYDDCHPPSHFYKDQWQEVSINITRSTCGAFIHLSKGIDKVSFGAWTAEPEYFNKDRYLNFIVSIVGSKPSLPPTLAAATAQDGVHLSWLNNTSSASRLIVQRRTGQSLNWEQIADVSVTPTTFVDSQIKDNTLYLYRSRSCNEANNACTPWSSEVHGERLVVLLASAASRRDAPVSPDMEVVALGADLAPNSASSSEPQLELEGVRAFVKDSLGVMRQALIKNVTPEKVTFIIPSLSELGQADIQLETWRGTARGKTTIVPLQPSLYAADEDKAGGVAQGRLQRVLPGGLIRRFEALAIRGENGSYTPVPIEYLHENDDLYLFLEASGFRSYLSTSSAASIVARVGGVPAQVLFAGPADAPGRDILIIRIPKGLRPGQAEINVSIGSLQANAVTISMK